MSMSQRTSSAAELDAGRQKQDDHEFVKALEKIDFEKELEGTKYAAPKNKFEFSPAKEPLIGAVFLKNKSFTTIGEYLIFDGFYLDSHGGRPAVTIVTYKDTVDGIFSEEAAVPSLVTRTTDLVGYFLTREMAEYCVKKMIENSVSLIGAVKTCHGKSYNTLIEQLEERTRAGHFDDGTVLIVNAETPDNRKPVMIGLTEILVNKKLHLVHVVADLDTVPRYGEGKALKTHDDLTNAAYYTSEQVARYGYRDRVLGLKSLDNLTGRDYSALVQHLTRSSK